MQTRSTNYSDNGILIRRIYNDLKKRLETFHRSALLNRFSDIQRIQKVNQIMYTVSKHIPMMMKLQEKSHNQFDSMEKLFGIFLQKKIEFEKHFEILSKKEVNKCPIFHLHYQKLLRKCKKLKNKINRYFDRKAAIVLIKTNRDIYRHVLSYL